jgi:A/G-specific adenine glycosylase
VDGNVFRVLSRYFDVETDIASLPQKKNYYWLSNAKRYPATLISNYGVGALQCVPKS